MVWLVLSAIVFGSGMVPEEMVRAQRDDRPAGSRQDEVYILGKDLLQLLEKDPDAVILLGEAARKYVDEAKARSDSRPASVVVQQCEIRGELLEDRARLVAEITARCELSGRNAVPLGLSDARLVSVSMDGGPPFLTRDGQGWVAWPDGGGLHRIIVEFELAVLGSKTQSFLACGIPEAPITRLELIAPRPLSELHLTPAAAITVHPIAEGRVQIEAALGSRTKFDMRWRAADEARYPVTPLLRASSQTTASVEPEGVQIKTELRIQSLRGSQQTVELRGAADERVLDLQALDGKFVAWQSTVEGSVQRLFLHYTEPLSGTSELMITSERPWSGNSGAIGGWVVQGAYSHWSLVAVRSVPELDVAVTGTENAQPTDSLPATLRSPRNEAGFASYGPYRLQLSILPRWIHATVRTSLGVGYGEDVSSIVARWQFTSHGGKVSQVDFTMPAPFRAENFVFSESIQSVREEETSSGRIAHVYLKGTPEEFEIRLRAALPIIAARNLVKLELPWPQQAESESSRLFIAGTADVDLDPTPNFVAEEDVPDDPIAKELSGNGSSVRAFQGRALLDQVAFRLSKASSAMWYETHAQLRIDQGSIIVHQDFEFAAQGTASRPLRLTVPAPLRGTVRVDAAPGRLVSDPQSEELVFRLTGDLPDPVHVKLSYRIDLPVAGESSQSTRVAVPLVSVANGSCESTDLVVTGTNDEFYRVVGGEWQAIPGSGSQRGAKPDESRWALRKTGSAESVELTRMSTTWLPKPATVVERAWIETLVNSQGAWRMRSKLVIAELESSPLRIRLPHGARLTGAWWNGQPVPVRRGSEPKTAELLESLPVSTPGICEIEMSGVAAKQPAGWMGFEWDTSLVVGDVVWGKVYWGLRLPEGMALLRGPAGWCDENQLGWHDHSLRIVPRLNDADLERWLANSAELRPVESPGGTLLYSRLLSTGPIQIRCTSRWLLVLLTSGLVMVIGLLVVALPRRGKLPLIIAALFCAMLLAATEPQAAAELVRSAGWGLLLAPVAGASHLLLTRRRSIKQSVFPAAGHLARAGGSTARRTNQGAAEAIEAPVSEPVNPPRLTASSSVR